MPRRNDNKRDMVYVHSYYRRFPKPDKDRKEIREWLETNKGMIDKAKKAKKWQIREPKLLPVPEIPEERKGMTFKEKIDRMWKTNERFKINMKNTYTTFGTTAVNIRGKEGMRAYFIIPHFINYAVKRFPELTTGTIHERYDKIVDEFEKKSDEKINSKFIKALIFEILLE